MSPLAHTASPAVIGNDRNTEGQEEEEEKEEE
jgi:hypothetical protein